MEYKNISETMESFFKQDSDFVYPLMYILTLGYLHFTGRIISSNGLRPRKLSDWTSTGLRSGPVLILDTHLNGYPESSKHVSVDVLTPFSHLL